MLQKGYRISTRYRRHQQLELDFAPAWLYCCNRRFKPSISAGPWLALLSGEWFRRRAISGGTMPMPTTNFILHELDERLAAQLCRAAFKPGQAFYLARSTSECLSLAERVRAGVVFCNSEPRRYQALLNEMKRQGLRLPVIVVSRI